MVPSMNSPIKVRRTKTNTTTYITTLTENADLLVVKRVLEKRSRRREELLRDFEAVAQLCLLRRREGKC